MFDVAGLQKRSKLKFYRQGIVSFDALERFGGLKPAQALQVQHTLHALPDHVETEEIAKFLEQLSCLLKYCGLDTYAMFKVWEKLREAADRG